MTFLTFPVLRGQGISVHKKPKWSTLVSMHVSGRQSRARRYQTPIWDFELTFDGLDATSSGYYGGLGAQTMQTMAGFFNLLGGAYQPFLYVDPTDWVVARQPIGVGDGSTRLFGPVNRSIGTFSFPVEYIVQVSQLYLNGVVTPQIGGFYPWTLYGVNQIMFTQAAPRPGVVISADFTYAYIVRFSDDVADFEEFMQLLMTWKTVKFQSARAEKFWRYVYYNTLNVVDSSGGGPGGPGPGVGEVCIPLDWNNYENTIHAIGAGAGGGANPGGMIFGAAGGGGGAYSWRNNVVLTPGMCYPVQVGVGGAGVPGGAASAYGGAEGAPTVFQLGSSNPTTDPTFMYAQGGGGSAILAFQTQAGGQASESYGDGAVSGGDGSTYEYGYNSGGGGGGAGGPHGVGGFGADISHNTTNGLGGGGAGGGAADGGGNGQLPYIGDAQPFDTLFGPQYLGGGYPGAGGIASGFGGGKGGDGGVTAIHNPFTFPNGGAGQTGGRGAIWGFAGPGGGGGGGGQGDLADGGFGGRGGRGGFFGGGGGGAGGAGGGLFGYPASGEGGLGGDGALIVSYVVYPER